ncbi:MAG: LysM peptidoglycan-binding domain-containing protein [Bacteroidota bacterium]
MRKIYSLFIAVLLANTAVSFANKPIDSIGVENNKGKKVIIYKVEAKETYYSISKKYNVNYKEVMEFNDSRFLQIGVTLKIPTNLPFSTAAPVLAISSSDLTEYTVKPKDNLNLLAQKFGTTVDAIKKLNHLTSNNLQIGQLLKISASVPSPIESPETTAETNTYSKPEKMAGPVNVIVATNTGKGLEHTVAANETIYSIAKKYGLTTYQIITANNLTSNELSIGQKLIIKGADTSNADTDADGDDNGNGNLQTLKDPSLRYPAKKYGLVQFEEKGAAIWIEDQDLDPSKMLILHRTAAVGTIIKVTNPLTNRSAFAKVVGKFTENESTKDVIIVMTKAVADAVGALDKRFFCNLSYGALENEQQ